VDRISKSSQKTCLKKKIKVKLNFVGALPKKEDVVEVEEGTTYSQILEMIGINPETVVIVKDKLPVPTDEKAEEGEVKVIRVISGG